MTRGGSRPDSAARQRSKLCRPNAVPHVGSVGLDYKAICPACGKRVKVTVGGRFAHHRPTPHGGARDNSGGSREGAGREPLGDDRLCSTLPATRVTEGERQLLEDAASSEGVSMSDALRAAVLMWVRKVLR